MTRILFEEGVFKKCVSLDPVTPKHGDLLYRLNCLDVDGNLVGAAEALEAIGLDYRDVSLQIGPYKWVQVVASGSVKCADCGDYFLPGPMLRALIDSWQGKYEPDRLKCGCKQYAMDQEADWDDFQHGTDPGDYSRYDQFREGKPV